MCSENIRRFCNPKKQKRLKIRNKPENKKEGAAAGMNGRHVLLFAVNAVSEFS